MYMDWEARSQWYKLRARATCAPGGLLAKPTVGVMLQSTITAVIDLSVPFELAIRTATATARVVELLSAAFHSTQHPLLSSAAVW